MSELVGESNARELEVAVIGAGQAGLAMGYFLLCPRRRFGILERAGEIALDWRKRWESLTLFTPRRSGLPFPWRQRLNAARSSA